jgi:hypothetical protein
MSRDIEDRIRMFMGEEESEFGFTRIALNMNQIRQYNPPPNPAKLTDSRSTTYVETHGDESWELDALSPTVLSNLIEREVASLRDEDQWQQDVRREKTAREQIKDVADKWDDLVAEIED